MMDLGTIHQMSQEAARKAAKANRQPFVVEAEDLADWKANGVRGFPFPFIGSYEPKGWIETNEYFVDSSGMGTDYEPALSLRKFLDKLVVGRGYAVTEAGQFQVYVTEYERSK